MSVTADPRPRITGEGRLAGARCTRCGHALLREQPRCARCRGATEPAQFGPEGTIWAHTVVHIPAFPGQDVPYELAYVDLDAGPRLLLQLRSGGGRACVGARARIAGRSEAGDPIGEVLG